MTDPTTRRPGLWMALAATASAATIALPMTIANAEPTPPPPSPTASAPAPASPAPAPMDPNAPVPPPAPADPNAPAAPAPPPAPVDPNAPVPPPAPADPNAPAAPAPPPAPVDPNAPVPPPAPVDPNAPVPPPAPMDPNAPVPPPAPVDPNAPAAIPAAPEAGRVNNDAGGFSYIVPAGWEVADASRLSYGQALLLKQSGPALPGQAAPTANDTSILLGRLDLKLFAGAEADNSKAAVRLASDMGEFFMPFAGTRLNQATAPLQAADMPGAAASYDVKFTDTAKPNGQIWAGVVGSAAPNPARTQTGNRWFVVWLGTAKDPVDAAAAKALAQSIRPYTPPPAPVAPAPDPNAPAVPPAPGNRVGVPVPVETPVPEMMPAG